VTLLAKVRVSPAVEVAMAVAWTVAPPASGSPAAAMKLAGAAAEKPGVIGIKRPRLTAETSIRPLAWPPWRFATTELARARAEAASYSRSSARDAPTARTFTSAVGVPETFGAPCRETVAEVLTVVSC